MISLDLKNFRAAGVYTLEYDQSESITVDTEALRLVVGFSTQGPFNTPVYLSSSADRVKVFGDINNKLEKKGCYFNRMTDTLLQSTPVFALNLLNVNTIDNSTNTDKVGYVILNTDSGYDAGAVDSSIEGRYLNQPIEELYYKFFNREKFWTPSSERLESQAALALLGSTPTGDQLSYGPILSVSNTGTKTMSVLVVKPSNLAGYNVTAKDWYGSITNIPYNWIRPNDYISNYFIQVVAIEGDWTNYQMLAADPYWSTYFNEKGLKPGVINSFANDPGINLIGSWVGSLIPDFEDKTGSNQFIESIVNNSTQLTGVLLSVNRNVLDILDYKWNNDGKTGQWILDLDSDIDGDEERAKYRMIDLVGHELIGSGDTSVNIDVLSYKTSTPKKIQSIVNGVTYYNSDPSVQVGNIASSSSFVVINPMEWNNLKIGDYIVNDASQALNIIPGVTPIINKIWIPAATFVNDASIMDTAGNTYFTVDGSMNVAISTPGWLLSSNFLARTGQTTVKDASAALQNIIKSMLISDASYGTKYAAQYISTDAKSNETYLNINGIYQFKTIDNVKLDKAKKTITKQLPLNSLVDGYNFIKLQGLKLTTRHLPGYDASGAPNLEEGVNKIYSMLADRGILRGLTNPDMINFRYVIDTMGYGLRPNMGGKHYLSELAMKRGKCTAILNAPSITQFANSADPYFCNTFISGLESKPVFNTEWIPEGGNPDMQRSFQFSLPSEDQGAKYCAVFGPYLKYNVGGKNMLVPPAADVANAFIRKFQGGDPYVIVANMNGILSNPNLGGVEYDLDMEDREYLEPFGYNAIINRNGNTMIYSNRTAYQTVKSDFNYLHVRELLNTIEIEIDAILQNYVFDYNNPVTRMAIVQAVTPVLQAMQDSGALYRFEVIMDSTNNTDEIIAEAFAIIDIGIEIARGCEKILQRITVYKTGGLSSGSNTTA